MFECKHHRAQIRLTGAPSGLYSGAVLCFVEWIVCLWAIKQPQASKLIAEVCWQALTPPQDNCCHPSPHTHKHTLEKGDNQSTVGLPSGKQRMCTHRNVLIGLKLSIRARWFKSNTLMPLYLYHKTLTFTFMIYKIYLFYNLLIFRGDGGSVGRSVIHFPPGLLGTVWPERGNQRSLKGEFSKTQLLLAPQQQSPSLISSEIPSLCALAIQKLHLPYFWLPTLKH